MECVPASEESLKSGAVGLAQLDAIRDAWLSPLVERIAEQAVTIGRLEERLAQEQRQVAERDSRLMSELAEKDELIARLHRRIAELAEELDTIENTGQHDVVNDLQARVSALEDATTGHAGSRRGSLRFRKP